ncbi:hypothetical protein [Viridibacillus arvi]|uniref:hypothetical protein n=1 Tax=Viridibacillus arvi TaxID=263475 RepID=UPI003D07D90E
MAHQKGQSEVNQLKIDPTTNTVREMGLFMDDAIFSSLSYTSIRVDELVVLKWKDIDLTK